MAQTIRMAGVRLKDEGHITVPADPEPMTPSAQEIGEAIRQLQRAVGMCSGASPSAQRILNFCFQGGDSDTIAFMDLCRLDSGNQSAALLLINLVASIRHTLPNGLLK